MEADPSAFFSRPDGQYDGLAERGLLGLAAWLGMLILLVAQAVRLFRHGEAPIARFLAAGALGVWVAGFVAGIFEYNFGDSEYQMLFLFRLSVPFALEAGFNRKPA